MQKELDFFDIYLKNISGFLIGFDLLSKRAFWNTNTQNHSQTCVFQTRFVMWKSQNASCNELHSVIRSYSAPDHAFPRVLVKILNGYCFGRPCDRVRSSQFTGSGGASLSPSSSTPPRHLTRFAPWRLTEGEIAGCDSTFESHARLSRFALPSLTRCTSSVRRAPVIHNQWLH